MGSEQEAGHDAEVSAPAPQSPQQVRILGFGSRDHAAIGENHVCLEQAVDGETVLAAEVAVSAAQRQARDAGRRDDPEGHRLTEGLGSVIDVASRAARAHSHRRLLGVDSHALHRRQVDDQAVIDAAETRTIVAAPANGDRELVLAAEIHGRDDIADIRTSSDEQRPLVDHGVVKFASLFIFGMAAPDQSAPKALTEFGDGLVVHGFPPEEPVNTTACKNSQRSRKWWKVPTSRRRGRKRESQS
jgi:hypothetical protein